MTQVPVPHCPDCDERMERGYRLDHGHNLEKHSQKWIQGEPVKTLLGRLKKAPMREIVVFRCKSCGLLRDYAV